MVNAGLVSGDLTFPIPFCPEFHFSEFNSAVADMKNSVAVGKLFVLIKQGVIQFNCCSFSLGSQQCIVLMRGAIYPSTSGI